MERAASVRATCRRQRQLGRELRRLFEHVAREPVPLEMLALLNNVDASEDNGPATEPDLPGNRRLD